jgi:hypothetical protein
MTPSVRSLGVLLLLLCAGVLSVICRSDRGNVKQKADVSMGNGKNPLACEIANRYHQCTGPEENDLAEDEDRRRIVAVGDVHGSLKGLLEVLYNANITMAPDKCEWRDQTLVHYMPASLSSDSYSPPVGTVLVQMGDLVDRGPQALEAYECMQHLQRTAPDFDSKVVRLIGSMFFVVNHIDF